MFDRVVVGVDGTDYGLEALQQTLALCPPDSTVSTTTALDTSISVHAGYMLADIKRQLEDEAERARATAAEILADRADSTARVVRGDAKTVLRHACAELDATLLALGGRGSSRFLGMMAGETASVLLHDAICPVLLARPQWGRRWQPSRVLVGVDGSELSLAALTVAGDLAERLGAEVTVVAATGGKPVAREEPWAERVTEWDPGHPFAALRDRSSLADLIVVGSRGLHGVRALGSVSERIAHRANCSVLVVHPATGASAPRR